MPCLNQVFRPKIKIKTIGRGDCTLCVEDESNKDCAYYVPITLLIQEIDYEQNNEREM
jgi:hypothetical protein